MAAVTVRRTEPALSRLPRSDHCRELCTGHGIAAAAGKLGGFIGVFLFPIFLHWRELLAAEVAAATVSVLGLVVTIAMLPETKGRSLEELNVVTRPKVQMAAGR